MKSGAGCTQAEILAGAIALGEASDAERHAYREHLSTCPRCVEAVGGEHEIERIVSFIALARDQERWQPDVRDSFTRPARARFGRPWAAGLAVAIVAALALILYRPHAPHVVTSAAVPVHAQLAQPDARAIAALGTQSLPRREHRAESLAFTSPDGMHRTITFEVRLDGHGRPTRCTIVNGSPDNGKLGASLCDAVMRTR